MVSYSSFVIICLVVLLMFTLGRLYQQEKACNDLLEFIRQQRTDEKHRQPLKAKRIEIKEEHAC